MTSINVPKNITCKKEFKVKPEHVAKHVGSGNVEVLSTPSMIAFMEATSLECVQKYLPEDYTTVGTMVNVKHLKPAPINATIIVESKLVKQEGRRLLFEVKAYWNNILIGEGMHERYIVNKRRFIEKLHKEVKQHPQ